MGGKNSFREMAGAGQGYITGNARQGMMPQPSSKNPHTLTHQQDSCVHRMSQSIISYKSGHLSKYFQFITTQTYIITNSVKNKLCLFYFYSYKHVINSCGSRPKNIRLTSTRARTSTLTPTWWNSTKQQLCPAGAAAVPQGQ